MINEESRKMIEDVDTIKKAMEKKWGIGVLEEAVADELKEKFERQYDKMVKAIDSKNDQEIQKHCKGTIKGWNFLDKEASKLIWASELSSNVWQVKHSNGEIMTIYNGSIDEVDKNGVVMSIQELVKFVPANVLEVKKHFKDSRVDIIKELEKFDDEIS